MDFVLGELQVKKIVEIEDGLPLSVVFPQIDTSDLRRLRRWYWSEELSETPAAAEIKLSFHSYVLQIGGKNILIDTCNGNHKNRNFPGANQLNTAYLDNLHASGLTPADIDFVLCTHLHFDHVGWNTRLENGRWVPTFPNARYLFTRLDYEYFSRHADDPIHGPAYNDSVLPIIEHGLAEMVETNHIVEHEISNGVWLEGAPGHSPGNCLIHAQRGGDLAIFSGDVFHHPIQLVRPDIHLFADGDPVLGAHTRTRLFTQHADSSTVFFPAHFRGNSGGRVCRDGDAFKFEFL